MGVRCFVAAAMVGGLAFLTGCPSGGILDGLFGDGTVIQDGTFSGDMQSTSEVWDADELYWEDAVDGAHTATFSKGALLKPSGSWLDVDDQDELDYGSLQISRVVHSVDYGDWGYEVVYDVDATWGDVPTIGTQVVTYWTRPDGGLDMYDDIKMYSLESFDGGNWEYEISGSGVLMPGGAGRVVADPLDNDILDKKSGKIRR